METYAAPKWIRTASGRLSSVASPERRWSELLPDLLQQISDCLPLGDYINFRHVCQSWWSAPSGRAHITKFSKSDPWLMIYRGLDGDERGLCYLYDKSYQECCTVPLPCLHGATCVESKHGWLLAYRDDDVFFYNPLSFEKINLPKYPKKIMDCKLFAFMSHPTSRECRVFAVQQHNPLTMDINLCHIDKAKWETRVIKMTSPVSPSKTRVLHCDCRFMNSILIEDPDMLTTYNFATGQVFQSNDDTPRYLPFHVIDEMRRVHKDKWLSRFGAAKGTSVCISYCRLSLLSDDSILPDGVIRLNFAQEGVTESKILKAAWLEPCFSELYGLVGPVPCHRRTARALRSNS